MGVNFRTDGVMCTGLSGFTTRPQSLAGGFRWLAPILLHDPAAHWNINEIRLNKPAYEREGWIMCGWGTYGQADTPENDAVAAANLCRSLGLAGWIANGEAWAEGVHADASHRFIDEWLEVAPAGCTLAVSCLSSDTASFARSFDYPSWQRIGAVIMPQVYGNERPGLTVGAALGMLAKAGVTEDEISLTYGTYPVNGKWTIPFTDYQGWSGPRGVYVGDATPADAWAKLSRAAARPNTPPNEEPDMEWYEQPYPTVGVPIIDVPLPYPLYPPDAAAKGKTPTADCPLTLAVKRGISRGGRWKWGTFDDTYSNAFAHGKGSNVIDTGVAGFQRQSGIDPTGWFGKGTYDVLVRAIIPEGLAHAGEPLLDGPALDYIRQAAKQGPPAPDPVDPTDLPDLGPMSPGGKSLLDLQLTHATEGIPLYPAVDECFGEHKPVLAVEDIVVDKHDSHSNPGEAFYATGRSGLMYWYAHLEKHVPLGTKFTKGAQVGTTIPTTIGGGPHAHLGVNAENYLGKGKQLRYGKNGNGPDYTFGSPTVGAQLTDVLV